MHLPVRLEKLYTQRVGIQENLTLLGDITFDVATNERVPRDVEG
jgi:hypothetical protein